MTTFRAPLSIVGACLLIALGVGSKMNREEDFISVFTESELKEALELFTTGEEAGRIANAVYKIPVMERPEYGWTETAVDLLAASHRTRNKAAKLWGPWADSELDQKTRWIRDFRAGGHVSEGVGVEDIVTK